jgi:3-hydroxy-9,10-secoandrosta-1,3,5(10)-triene-9,17-dione monooxygenase
MTVSKDDRVLDKIMERAAELTELGPVNESLGRLDDKAAKVLRDSGMIRMLQPRKHGGLEAHPREFAETVMGIAALDGSSGWVAGIVGVHPWEMAMADPKVQEEIWGEDPDTWIASPYAPMGIARPVEGGYVFNGHWQFSSGTDHCDWIFLGAMLGDAEGKMAMPPTSLHMILPRSDYEIVEDSWDVAGLRGTGSKDIIVRDAFVPAYRTIEFNKVVEGIAPKEAGLSDPCYHVPFSCAFPLGITAAVIGMAEGALTHHLAWQRTRVQITGTRVKDDPYVLYAIGEAEIMMRSGGNALRSNNPIQRFWRDAHMGLAHAIHVPGSVYHASALTDLDVEVPQGPMRSMI